MILRPVASFSQSMSPWRAMATPFGPDFPKFKPLIFMIDYKCQTKAVFSIFWRVLRGGYTHIKRSISNASIYKLGGIGGKTLTININI